MMSLPVPRKVKLALVSSGLGNVCRGFEISTARWYEALKNVDWLDVRLYSGAEFGDAIPIPHVPRDSNLYTPVRQMPLMSSKQRWEITYGLEQMSFATAIVPMLTSWDPDVVWTKDVPLAHMLHYASRLTNQNWKVMFSNGGGLKPQNYNMFDFVQHIQPESFRQAVCAGLNPSKMAVVTNLVRYEEVLESRDELRHDMGFSPDDFLIVSVAAWNTYYKRIDYLIKEVAQLKDKNVKLILCGQPETETAALQRMGSVMLGDRVRWLTVSPSDIYRILKASDVFVLSSTEECLGAVLIEAAMAGLPVISHPHAGAKFVLEDEFWMTDMTKTGNLAEKLREFRANPPSPRQVRELKESVFARFGQKHLVELFCESIMSALGHQSAPRELVAQSSTR